MPPFNFIRKIINLKYYLFSVNLIDLLFFVIESNIVFWMYLAIGTKFESNTNCQITSNCNQYFTRTYPKIIRYFTYNGKDHFCTREVLSLCIQLLSDSKNHFLKINIQCHLFFYIDNTKYNTKNICIWIWSKATFLW